MDQKTDNYTFYCSCLQGLELKNELAFFESHNSMDFAGNMLAIAKELSQNPEKYRVKIVISCLDENRDLIKSCVERYAISVDEFVIRESKRYFEVLATAKYLFTDVAFYSLFQKRKGQICVTTWHGTPLKTLGYTFYEDAYVVANQKRGFILADYFVCPNEYTWECIKTSYQLDGLFNGKVVFAGYPRNAIFFDEKRREQLKAHLDVDGKKVIVYMPTWRGKVIEVKGQEQSHQLQRLLSEIDKTLSDDCIVWAKLHRLNQAELDFSVFDRVRPFPTGFDTYDVLNTADVLVTDYSSVMFDFANTGKKIVLYCYDKEDYVSNRGCYFDMEKLPFPIVTTVKELICEICSERNYDDRVFLKTYCDHDQLEATRYICSEIVSHDYLCDGISCTNEDQKNLIFVGDLNENHATDAVFDFLYHRSEDSLYVTYLNHLFKEKSYKLLQLGKWNQIPFYMYQGRYVNYTHEESIVMSRIRTRLAEKKCVFEEDWMVLENLSKREYVRFQYENKFQVFIRYAGLDLESLKFFRVFKNRKILYIHDNMAYKAESNYEYWTYLYRAMEVADEIHYANMQLYLMFEDKVKKLKGKVIIEQLY